MIRAVIFDMDGLLIETSPFWKQAELEVLSSVGVPLTREMLSQTPSGLREDEIVAFWYEQYPWADKTISQVTNEIETHVAENVSANGKAMPGVHVLIQYFREKQLPMAIASSSSDQVITAVVSRLGLSKDILVTCSAYDEAEGKPNPAVYISALGLLNNSLGKDIAAHECLTFEDSLNGVKAAKAAGMICIAVPHAKNIKDKGFNIADTIVPSLLTVTPEFLQRNIA